MVSLVSRPLGKEWLCLLDPCPSIKPLITVCYWVTKGEKARRPRRGEGCRSAHPHCGQR